MQILFQVRILIILFCCKKYLCRHIHFWDMAEPIKQRVAVHCFENLVQFLNLQKFNTDWKSVAWRKLFLNICLSGIDELGLKRVDLAAVFSLQPRTLNDYRTALSRKYSSQNHQWRKGHAYVGIKDKEAMNMFLDDYPLYCGVVTDYLFRML